MKRLFIVLWMSTALFAEDIVSRIVKVNYLNMDTAHAVLETISASRAKWRADGNSQLVVMTGPVAVVDAMEAAIKSLDIPSPAAKNVEVTFHILAAGGQPGTGAVPSELEGVAKQLGNTFGMKSFRVLESAVLRGRENKQFSTNGLINVPVSTGTGGSATYVINCRRLSTSTSSDRTMVKLDFLEFRINFPIRQTAGTPGNTTLENLRAGFTTDVDIREGQKLVVGKTSLDAATPAVFLVVSAKVVD